MSYTFLFNYDIRHSDENFFANRIAAFFTKPFNIKSIPITAKATPFVEVRHSVRRHKRERLATGVEFGLEPKNLFYLGEQFRYVWHSEQLYNRGVIKDIDMFEAVSILTLSCRLIPHKDILKGYISGEYTYDFRKGSGTRIESLAGILMPIGKSFEANLDWRHRDRIHADDCDTFEMSGSYKF